VPEEQKKVIIVEDEAFIVNDLVEKLKSLNFNVVATFVSGEETLDFVKNQKLKDFLVLSDIFLNAKMDGIKLAKKLTEYKIPVILISAYSDDKTFKKALKIPVFGFIQKPYDTFVLKSAIEIALKLNETIKNLEEKISFITRELEKKEKEILNETNINKQLLLEKENLEKEIASINYYIDLIKSETQKNVLEKEKLQKIKSEIFSALNFYLKVFEFFDKLFCNLLRQRADITRQIVSVLDEFLFVFEDSCKGIRFFKDRKEFTNSRLIQTDFSYSLEYIDYENSVFRIKLYFGKKESIEEYETRGLKKFLSTFLKIMACFYEKRENVEIIENEKKLIEKIYDSFSFPVVYHDEKRCILNSLAKKYFVINNEAELKEVLIFDSEKVGEEIDETLLKKKEDFIEFSCKLKTKDGILKNVKVRRSPVSLDGENRGFLDIILV
jgi:FixJ family two-component response regulator